MKRVFFACLLLSGCMMGPNYEPPENTVADRWNTVSTGEVSQEVPLTEWWKSFNDPLLSEYIEKGVKHNHNVLAAEDNIVQARAMRQVAASNLFPQLNGLLAGDKIGFSKNGPIFGNPVISAIPVPPILQPIMSIYNALFDASWEIDLFGKTRRQIQASEAQIGEAEETRNDILISVMAEIARNYIEVRSSQRNVVLVEDNITLLEQNTEIVRKNVEGGLSNQLVLETIEANLAALRATLPDLYAQVYRGIYTVSILTGDLPEALLAEMLPLSPLPHHPSQIAIGLRSDLLRRRPDVRKSERELAYATANLGVAVASFFPSINLLGLAGFDSLRLKNLFTERSKTWLVGGDFNIPIFQGGQLMGNLKANRASVSSAAHTYHQTVLTALQDAETALTNYTHDLKTVDQWKENSRRNLNLVYLTEERFTKGLVGFTDYLSIKQQLITAEQNLLQSDTKALIDLVALYKALGGGWEAEK